MWGARWRGGMALSSLPGSEGIGSRFGAHAWMRQVFTEGGRWELSLLSSFSRPFLFLVLSHKQLLVGENIFLPNIPGSYTVADYTTLRERWMLCCTFHSICPSAAVYFSVLDSVLLHVYVSLSLSSVLFASLSLIFLSV